MRLIRNIFAVALSFIMCKGAIADAPPEPPNFNRLSCSINGRWCAKLEHQGGVQVYRAVSTTNVGKGKLVPVWSAPLKHHMNPSHFLTSDGKCVIDSTSNLIEQKVNPSDPAFTIFCKDGARHVLPFDMFIDNLAALSRYDGWWSIRSSIDRYDRLIVDTPEGRRFLINAHNGQVISVTTRPPVSSPEFSSPPR